MTPENRIRLQYVLADLLSTNLAVLIFNVIRYFELPKAYTSFNTLDQFLMSSTVLAGQILFPLGMLGIYYLSGIYSRVYMRSRVSEFLTTTITAAIGTLVIIFVALINDLSLDRQRDYSLFLIVFVLLLLLVYLPRLMLTMRMQRKVTRGRIRFNTLVVGYGSAIDMVGELIDRLSPRLGMQVAGVVDFECPHISVGDKSYRGKPLFGSADAAMAVETLHINRIIVIPDPKNWERTVGIVNSLISLERPILVSADSLPPLMFAASILNLGSDPFIDISSSRHSASTMNIKRASDIVVSLIVLLLTILPGLIVALLIKIDSKGPVFYRQQRVGRHKRVFNIIKLRTMRVDSEADGVPRLSSRDDDRVTRIGRILRRYRLDEFPQFINVLRGDMSLVGPRPERMHFVREIIAREPSYTFVYSVRPGITSLGMVKFGYASTFDEIMRRTRYDMLYVEHISIINDIKIMLHTINTVIRGKGV